MEAGHELSAHRGRGGTLGKEVKQYWWPEMNLDDKDWGKPCE